MTRYTKARTKRSGMRKEAQTKATTNKQAERTPQAPQAPDKIMDITQPLVDLAVLGPKNTFSSIAAQKYTKSRRKSATIAYTTSIPEIFEMVNKKQAKLGIVPIENLLNGTIRETFDELFEKNVQIIDKFNLNLKMALVAMPGGKKKDINIISSHAQALQQCKKFLGSSYPNTKHVGTHSTIAAYEKMHYENNRSTAVIIPQKVAEDINCNILAKNISDNKKNRTTFVVIKKKKNPATSKIPGTKKQSYETSIAFYFDKDKPGSLFKIFKDFADEKINLSHIESRPSRKELGSYIFYLDFEGHPTDPKCKKVLNKITKKVKKLKILGTYTKSD